MIEVIFESLERSELARQTAMERVEQAVRQSAGLSGENIKVFLGSKLSDDPSTQDLFLVRVVVGHGGDRPVFTASSPSLFSALEEIERLLVASFGSTRKVGGSIR